MLLLLLLLLLVLAMLRALGLGAASFVVLVSHRPVYELRGGQRRHGHGHGADNQLLWLRQVLWGSSRV